MRSSRPLVRRVAAAGLALLLAGCAGEVVEPEKVTRVAPQDGVTPRPLEVAPLPGYAPEQQLALLLISHYLSGPLYRMSNPLLMSREYRLAGALRSPDGRRLMVMMQHQQQAERWAMVSLSTTPGSVMNAFEVVRNGQPGYALVLKNTRICLVEGADQPPAWSDTGWRFSPTGAGRFECSGQTRGSLYQAYSGMPGLMGVYAEDGDTVLYAERWAPLRDIAAGLRAVFPNLKVPHVL